MSKQHRRGDIYYCDLGRNHGSLQSGLRPVVILQNDVGNRYSPTTIVVPMTSVKKKLNLPTHVPLEVSEIVDLQINMTNSVILFEQILTVNTVELLEYLGWVNLDKADVIRALGVSLGLLQISQ